MRGALLDRERIGRHEGIIPAYAGSTTNLYIGITGRKDHPRVCGEHVPASSVDVWSMGSSPRMRGALGQHLGQRGVLGIIPAYAGSTSNPLCCLPRVGDHPRVCGEHVEIPSGCVGLVGSSPRMRGALIRDELHDCVLGIIPAYAGSTRALPRGEVPSVDHPRVCGEHSVCKLMFSALRESSPRMRGAQWCRSSANPEGGIIPAYAGSTQASKQVSK